MNLIIYITFFLSAGFLFGMALFTIIDAKATKRMFFQSNKAK
tara:strand:+ start:322 stop:447 length:126 start_codon:yes stop_codon:yes gene_type:complete